MFAIMFNCALTDKSNAMMSQFSVVSGFSHPQSSGKKVVKPI